MKRIALVFALLAAGVALAGGVATSWSEAQALTRADPTAPTEGLSLSNVTGFQVAVCAEATRTLTGGTLKAWVYNPSSQLWARNADLDLTVGAPATRCRAFPQQRVSIRNGGRVLYANSSVTVSAGTTATVRIDAWAEQP